MTIRNSFSKIFRRHRGRYWFLGNLAAIAGFVLSALMIFAVLATLVDAAPVMQASEHQADDEIVGRFGVNSYQ